MQCLLLTYSLEVGAHVLAGPPPSAAFCAFQASKSFRTKESTRGTPSCRLSASICARTGQIQQLVHSLLRLPRPNSRAR